jgi:signal peptidase
MQHEHRFDNWHRNHTRISGLGNISTAPPETGSYRRYVAEHRYPILVPVPVIDALYMLHPIAPVVVIDILVSIPFVLLAHRMNASPRTRDSPGAESTGLFKFRL